MKIFLLSILFLSNFLFAQTDSTSQNIETGLFVYPYAFYSPETNFAAGLGGISYFAIDKNKPKPSSILFSFFYTANHQFQFYTKPLLRYKQIFIFIEFEYSKMIDKFYGIGSESTESFYSPDYIFNQINFRIKSRLNTHLIGKFGGILVFNSYKIADKKSNLLLDDNSTLGITGGKVLSIGFDWGYDSRDNAFFPSSGEFLESYFIISPRVIGSDFKFSELEINLRKYESIDNNIFALQFYTKNQFGSPPFYLLPKLGGSFFMRGIYLGRFRDKLLYTLQIEYRRIFFWNFGAVIFTSLGDVSDSFENYLNQKTKFSYGAGVRYRFDSKQKINLRADFGVYEGEIGFYLQLEEAF